MGLLPLSRNACFAFHFAGPAPPLAHCMLRLSFRCVLLCVSNPFGPPVNVQKARLCKASPHGTAQSDHRTAAGHFTPQSSCAVCLEDFCDGAPLATRSKPGLERYPRIHAQSESAGPNISWGQAIATVKRPHCQDCFGSGNQICCQLTDKQTVTQNARFGSTVVL